MWKKAKESNFLGEIDWKLLEKCLQHDYKIVSVGMSHELIPFSCTHPYEGINIFCVPGEKSLVDGFPAIWKISSDLNISAGCGSFHCVQMVTDNSLLKATYKYENDEWHVIIHPSVIKNISQKFNI